MNIFKRIKLRISFISPKILKWHLMNYKHIIHSIFELNKKIRSRLMVAIRLMTTTDSIILELTAAGHKGNDL